MCLNLKNTEYGETHFLYSNFNEEACARFWKLLKNIRYMGFRPISNFLPKSKVGN